MVSRRGIEATARPMGTSLIELLRSSRHDFRNRPANRKSLRVTRFLSWFGLQQLAHQRVRAVACFSHHDH
jgi:hypothetical protein